MVSEKARARNLPESAILAVGGIREELALVDGEIAQVRRMKVTMSSDHRVIDGASAARFLSTLRTILENPASLAL